MNILILTNNIGGLHSFRKEVVQAIVDAGYEVYISEPDDDERAKWFEGIGCHIVKTVFNRRGMNPIADGKLMLAYRKMIKQLRLSISMYKHFFKRFLDFWISLIALICVSPILLVVTIWLHFANKKGSPTPTLPEGEGEGYLKRWLQPVIFTQERPGKDAKIFKVIKFKTMTDERDAEGNLLSDAQRLTKVGKFVRSTSIDELPQLINVLKGDMALIGPRP